MILKVQLTDNDGNEMDGFQTPSLDCIEMTDMIIWSRNVDADFCMEHSRKFIERFCELAKVGSIQGNGR